MVHTTGDALSLPDTESWKESGRGGIKRFLSSRLTRAFPGFPEREQRGNYHRRIVCGCDKGVRRGHVARARSRDARRCQARRVQREILSFIYLNNSNRRLHPVARVPAQRA